MRITEVGWFSRYWLKAALLLPALVLPFVGFPSPAHAQDIIGPAQTMNVRLDITDSQITVSWDPIKYQNDLVGYNVTALEPGMPTSHSIGCGYGLGGTKTNDYLTFGTSCVLHGLQPGIIYNVFTHAGSVDPNNANVQGGGLFTVNTVATGQREWVSLCCQVPQAPLTPSAEDLGGSTAHVTWSPPAFTGGANSLTFDVTSTPPSAGCSTTALECTIPNLSYSTPYTFQVVARNSAGPSGAAATNTPLSLIPPRPGEPTSAKATMSGHIAQVSWKAPADAKKLAVSSYKVVAFPGGKSCVSKKTSCAIKGLNFGTKYTFTVKAFRGNVGSGLSHASLPVSYSPPPPAPAPVAIADPKPVPTLS